MKPSDLVTARPKHLRRRTPTQYARENATGIALAAAWAVGSFGVLELLRWVTQ